MDTSSSELQELRRLVGELTARVFRLERALNLPPGVAAKRRGPRHPATPPPPAPDQSAAGDADHSARGRAAGSIRKSRAAATWNPASVRTG